jgi:LysM repeat protein
MTNLRNEILRGFGAAGLIVVAILSGFMISSSESEVAIPLFTSSITPEPSEERELTEIPTSTITHPATNTMIPTQTITATSTHTFTPTFTATPTACPIPAGWKEYTVKQGDTLENLAKSRKITVDAIKTGNCLVSDQIVPGNLLLLPPIPPEPTATKAIETESCSQPEGWIVYTIQPGDTLYALSVRFGVSVQEIQQVNCMGSSTLLEVGKTIYLPQQPVSPGVPTPSGGIPTVVPVPIPTSGG